MVSFLSNFNYQIMGENANSKLVFLHGLMGFGSNWKTMARHFSSKYQILLYDQRGHGRSFQPTQGYKLQDYAEDLEKILNELGWQDIILVGHSMGARVAAQFAEHFPERVKKLILVDMGPVSDMASMLAVEERIKFIPTPFKDRNEARQFFDGPFMEKYNNETVKQFFYANLTDNKAGEMGWRFYLPGILEILWQGRVGNQWKAFESFQMPTLLVRGELSKDLSRDLFEEVVKKNSHILGIEVADAGHWVHVEKPQELVQIFEDFLKD